MTIKKLFQDVQLEKLKDHVKSATEIADYSNEVWEEYIINTYNKLMNDSSNKKERIKNLLCKRCCYRSPELSCQAFTSYKCRGCEEEFDHPNSSVPRLCLECAKTLKLCYRCCGSLK